MIFRFVTACFFIYLGSCFNVDLWGGGPNGSRGEVSTEPIQIRGRSQIKSPGSSRGSSGSGDSSVGYHKTSESFSSTLISSFNGYRGSLFEEMSEKVLGWAQSLNTIEKCTSAGDIALEAQNAFRDEDVQRMLNNNFDDGKLESWIPWCTRSVSEFGEKGNYFRPVIDNRVFSIFGLTDLKTFLLFMFYLALVKMPAKFFRTPFQIMLRKPISDSVINVYDHDFKENEDRKKNYNVLEDFKRFAPDCYLNERIEKDFIMVTIDLFKVMPRSLTSDRLVICPYYRDRISEEYRVLLIQKTCEGPWLCPGGKVRKSLNHSIDNLHYTASEKLVEEVGIFSLNDEDLFITRLFEEKTDIGTTCYAAIFVGNFYEEEVNNLCPRDRSSTVKVKSFGISDLDPVLTNKNIHYENVNVVKKTFHYINSLCKRNNRLSRSVSCDHLKTRKHDISPIGFFRFDNID